MPLINTAREAKKVMQAATVEARTTLGAFREAKLRASREWNPGARRDLLAAIEAGALAELTRIEMKHKAAADAFGAELSAIRGAPGRLGTDEALGWERLKSHLEAAASRGSTVPRIQIAIERLERAQAEGDIPMIRAARSMLPDYIGAPLARDHRRFLDVVGGDDQVREAVALDEEGHRGIPWTAQAISWVKGEVKGEVDNVTLLPTWEGSTVALHRAPDYAAAQRSATAGAAETLAAAGYRPSAAGGVARTGGSGPAPAGDQAGDAGGSTGSA